VRASWSPRTGLSISDIGPDFGLDLRLEGSLKTVVDVHVAWFSILRKEYELASFKAEGGPKFGEIFGSGRLSGAQQSGPGGPSLGESMKATEFGTGIRDRFQSRKDMTDYVRNITEFLGGSNGELKREVDKKIDPDKLPDSQARAQRLAEVISSGRAANLARRYGLREGGTLAVDLFQELQAEAKAGEARRGLLLGMDQNGDLVVADLAVQVLGMERDWWDFWLPGRERMRIRVLDVSAFYDRYARRSAFTGLPKWVVGQERYVNENPLEDSPIRPFAPSDCPNCHKITQKQFQPTFQFDPTTPLEEATPGSSLKTCTTCHKPSPPLTGAPSFQSPRFGSGSGYTIDLTEAQRRALLQFIEASQDPPAKPQ